MFAINKEMNCIIYIFLHLYGLNYLYIKVDVLLDIFQTLNAILFVDLILIFSVLMSRQLIIFF